MKFSVVILVACFVVSCKVVPAQNEQPVEFFQTGNKSLLGVKTPNYRGTIFTETYPFKRLFTSSIDSTKRFTPTPQELVMAEDLLKQQLKSLNKLHMNQVSGCPVLDQKLNSYFRQYVGFVDENGNRIIHVNFTWDEYSLRDKLNGYPDKRLQFDSPYNLVFDGCSYYWQININLSKKKLSDLQVNGVA